MADDDWDDDEAVVPIPKTTSWQPAEPARGGRRPPRPRNPTDKRLIFQVLIYMFCFLRFGFRVSLIK